MTFQFPKNAQTVAGLIAGHASMRPDAPAVLSRDAPPLNYAKLNSAIASVAQSLHDCGLGRGDRIVVALPTRVAAYVAMLTLSGTATVVLIDPQATQAEFQESLTRLRADALLTSEALPLAIAAADLLSTPVLIAHEDKSAAGLVTIDGPKSDRVYDDSAARSEDIGLILMSSGTTGRSKAIPLDHRVILMRASENVETLGITSEDVAINFRPAHMGGGMNIGLMTSIFAGGAVVIQDRFDADGFYADLRDFGVTWYGAGPAFHEALLERAEVHRQILDESRFRLIRSASYHLPLQTRARIERELGARVVQKYGSTESGLITTERVDDPDHIEGSVGRVWNAKLEIRDEEGRRCAAGKEGVIFVQGASQFAGYDNDPELTSKTLANGWVHTGDVGYVDTGGYLTIVGRAGDIINRGGIKVSPKEVEAALITHPDVNDCVVFGLDHPTLGQMSTAVVVLAADAPKDAARLTEYLRADLSQFKIPDRIVFRSNIPREEGGKFSRVRAADTFGLSTETRVDDGAEATRTPLEKTLSKIWRRVLNIEFVRADDHFVRIGGDSLRAMRLILEVQEATGVLLEAEAIYGSAATISGMATAVALARHDSTAQTSATAAIVARGDGKPCPLSFAQERLWVVQETGMGSNAYRGGSGLRLDGPIDSIRLRHAIEAVVARHEALRTRIVPLDGRLMQVFDGSTGVDLKESDLSELTTARSEQELQLLAATFFSLPYDLENGPLYRCKLVRLPDQRAVFLMPRHHIINDALSTGIVASEILSFYHSDTADLPDPVQYGDFSNWLRENLSDARLAELTAFWSDHLKDAPTQIALPSNRPRPPVANFNGARMRVAIQPETVRKLRKMASLHETTLFSAALAAFQLVYARFVGETDFILGTATDLRPRGTGRRLVGFCVNTLALRARVDIDQTFAQHLERARDLLNSALKHQDMPFEKVVQLLNPPRSQAMTPLVQVLFGMTSRGTRSTTDTSARFDPFDLVKSYARFDLSIMLSEEDGDQIGGSVEYRKDLFDASTINRLVDAFEIFIDSACNAPDQAMSKIPLQSSQDVERINQSLIGSHPGYPETTIPQVFQSVAMRYPDITAIGGQGQTTSYRDLETWSDQIANRLVDAGVAVGNIVAISAERSHAFVAGTLGILKAGAAYLPLDPNQPEARNRHIVSKAAVNVLLVQDGSVVPGTFDDLRQIPLRSNFEADHVAEKIDRSDGTDARAYVIFTSGSTGHPKGVVIKHRGVLRLTQNTDVTALGPGHIYLQIAPTTFDVSIHDIWGSLLNGGTIILGPSDLPDFNELGALLRGSGANAVEMTTPLFEKMVDLALNDFCEMQQVIVGGDALSVAHAKKFKQRFPSCNLINAYGPTEITVWAAAHHVTGDEKGWGIPIGKPIAHTRAYILDENMQVVPFGVEGELYLGGPGVAEGYLGEPDLTKAHFLPNPFTAYGQMYKTGDRVQLDANGHLQFRGRRDFQTKIRGFRVEPTEVSAKVTQIEGVEHSAIIPHKRADGQKELLAFYTPAPDSVAPNPEGVRNELRQALPPYLIPARIFQIDSLPLTMNGKLDREHLLTLVAQAPKKQMARVKPETEIEHNIAAIVEFELGLNDPDTTQSLFELGLDSLKMMQIFFQLQKEYDTTLSLRDAFRRPTIREIAASCQQNSVLQSSWTDPIICPLLEDADQNKPFFVVSGAGGHVTPFAGVAAQVSSDWSGIGLLDPTLVHEKRSNSIEALATRMIHAVREVTQNGPILLFGYSFGGHVAFEMAHQLTQLGHASGVVLIDTNVPQSSNAILRNTRIMARQFKYKFFDAVKTTKTELDAELRDRRNLSLAQRRLIGCYHAPKTCVPTVLIRRRNADNPRGEAYGWDEISDLQAILKVDGTHLDLFKDKYEAGFGKALLNALDMLDRKLDASH